MKATINPRWGKRNPAARHSGLSVRQIDVLVSKGLIRSALVRQPGCARGTRLIDMDSLDAFIEAGVGETTDLEMNRRHQSKTEAAVERVVE